MKQVYITLTTHIKAQKECTWGEDTVHISGLQQAVVKLLSDSLQLLIKAGCHQHVVNVLWTQLLLGVKEEKKKPTTMKHTSLEQITGNRYHVFIKCDMNPELTVKPTGTALSPHWWQYLIIYHLLMKPFLTRNNYYIVYVCKKPKRKAIHATDQCGWMDSTPTCCLEKKSLTRQPMICCGDLAVQMWGVTKLPSTRSE